MDCNRQTYRRREPEHTVLHEIVREELEPFLARARQRDHPVPGFVERELRAYLDCGILARGFVRARCDGCGPLCANWNGVSLHAAVCVPARDRGRLERLVRYVERSPLSLERLSRAPDGRLIYKLKHRWRDGTTHVAFEPANFITKLAALVPPPRAHLVRYHGLLAPCASERDRVVPGTPRTSLDAQATCQPDMIAPGANRSAVARSNPCPRCGGRMRIIAAICGREAKDAILERLGLPSRALP